MGAPETGEAEEEAEEESWSLGRELGGGGRVELGMAELSCPSPPTPWKTFSVMPRFSSCEQQEDEARLGCADGGDGAHPHGFGAVP